MTDAPRAPRPIDQLLSLGDSPADGPLVDRDELAWLRSGDLLLGLVVVTDKRWAESCMEAYSALDEQGVVEPAQRWSVVLYVRLPSGSSERVARDVEADLRGSRKLALLANEEPINPHVLQGTNLVADRPHLGSEPIERALEEIARGGLRAALGTLLLLRRPSVDVRRLIELLGSAEDEYGINEDRGEASVS